MSAVDQMSRFAGKLEDVEHLGQAASAVLGLGHLDRASR